MPKGNSFPTNPKSSIQNGHFIDSQGRVCILRGINLGGSSKLPYNYNQFQSNSFLNKNVTFVNRPFPLKEADEHFTRLKHHWGFQLIRLIVTWEAVEHSGPGIYDTDYLTYIKELVKKANEYELLIYIDPHQDVWSRFTGGDGAPLWTLECIGFDCNNFGITKAAISVESSKCNVLDFPTMIWPTNYYKYACATMFTLFWGGNIFAPSCFVDGIPVQEFLQSHYINAMVELAKYLVGLDNVLGFGSMNEPSSGYIGVKDLSSEESVELKYGYSPTPFQGMCLSHGISQYISYYSIGIKQFLLNQPDFIELVNSNGAKAWKNGYDCVWLKEGVWDIVDNEPKLLKPNYFENYNFGRDFYLPFAQRYTNTIRIVLPHTMLFVELEPFKSEFPIIDPSYISNVVNATHWYDAITLFTQRWRPHVTVDIEKRTLHLLYKNVRKVHENQLRAIKETSQKKMFNAPTLIGETGIQFNSNNDYEEIEALDHTISCIETNMLSYAIWNYTADNDSKYGDYWNRENLSIFSRPQSNNDGTKSFEYGARAMEAFIRPFPIRINGIPIESRYNRKRGSYILRYTSEIFLKDENGISNLQNDIATIIKIPAFLCSDGYSVSVSDGFYKVDADDYGWDIICYYHNLAETHHRVIVTSNARCKTHDAYYVLMLIFILLSISFGSHFISLCSSDRMFSSN